MALINCDECGSQVSDKAVACPRCGAPVAKASDAAAPASRAGLAAAPQPIPKMKTTSKVAASVMVVLLAAASVWLYANGRAPSPASTAAAPTSPAPACATDDLQCLGSKGRFLAAEYCRAHIERLAQYSVRWTDSYSTPKFSKFNWTKEEGGSITYIGDRIEFQTALGAYQPMYYLCDVGIDGKSVTGVRAYPGRLP